MTDLLALAAQLVAIPSVSHAEAEIADFVEAELQDLPGLEVTRIGDNVVARTHTGRGSRVLLAGHLDTVPPSDNAHADVQGEVLHGCGSADMKGGVALIVDLAKDAPQFVYDTTYVLYAREEVSREHSGLLEVERSDPGLLVADAAILAEPTGGVVEAGCQGMVRAYVNIAGKRAHSARPWAGVNAIHRLGPVLDRIASLGDRRFMIDGCEYRESVQVVRVSGGVANNVVPDAASLLVSYRFAPDKDEKAAFAWLEGLLGEVIDTGQGDEWIVEDSAPAARPCLEHPVLEALVKASGSQARAKLGWTDVAFFSERGIPAANFGPADPLLAHSADECVSRRELDQARMTLATLLAGS